jgi:hypothetical protein
MHIPEYINPYTVSTGHTDFFGSSTVHSKDENENLQWAVVVVG